MEIVYDREGLSRYIRTAVKASPRHPVLIDRFLERSTEIDVDAVCDGEDVYIGAIMQHVEEAGVHSGDSACVIPTVTLGGGVQRRIEEQTAALAGELGVVGLMNVQFALQQTSEGTRIYVLEVNPRGSRTVPFVSKATGVPLARVATQVIAGHKLRDLNLPGWQQARAEGRIPRRRDLSHVAVKEAVLPFPRFPGVDTTLGPEMKSTGEVMGVASSFPLAFGKAELAAGTRLPRRGTVFMSVTDADKDSAVLIARLLQMGGFDIVATNWTHKALARNGITAQLVLKHTEGEELRLLARGELPAEGPLQEEAALLEERAGIVTVVDLIEEGKVALVINTPRGRGARADGYEIRRAAMRRGVPLITTMAAALAAVQAMVSPRPEEHVVHCLQDLHAQTAGGGIHLLD